jgi:hypothetical protein
LPVNTLRQELSITAHPIPTVAAIPAIAEVFAEQVVSLPPVGNGRIPSVYLRALCVCNRGRALVFLGFDSKARALEVITDTGKNGQVADLRSDVIHADLITRKNEKLLEEVLQ